MRVLGALLLPFLRMKVGPQVYVGVEAVEGRCKSLGSFGPGTEDVERLPEFREDTTNPGWRNMADRLGL